MDFFHYAKAVRLRSHHDKYPLAEEDEESVTQERNGSSKRARWTVEFVPETDDIIRLKSCFGKYRTACNQPYVLGMTGRKVLQTLPRALWIFCINWICAEGRKVRSGVMEVLQMGWVEVLQVCSIGMRGRGSDCWG